MNLDHWPTSSIYAKDYFLNNVYCIELIELKIYEYRNEKGMETAKVPRRDGQIDTKHSQSYSNIRYILVLDHIYCLYSCVSYLVRGSL